MPQHPFEYDPAISRDKALQDTRSTVASGSVFGGLAFALVTIFGSDMDAQSQAAVVGAVTTLGTAITQGIKRYRRNRAKHTQ